MGGRLRGEPAARAGPRSRRCSRSLEGLARFALLKLFHFPAPFGELMLYVVLPQALYNGFLGAALVLALAWAESTRGRTS